MRALITGTPMQVEGEPAEIAQLVELLSSGAVMVEHVHQWRVGGADDDGVQKGRCWCGQERSFAPWGETVDRRQFALKDAVEPRRSGENVVAASQPSKARRCKLCGLGGHDARKCPHRGAS